jgi:uncharacterized protein YigE (DUF2233 family)
MRRFVSILSLLLAATAASSQFVAKHNLRYKNAVYDVMAVAVDSAVANAIELVENTNALTEEDFFKSSFISGLFAGITASVVDSTCRPLGLYVSDHQLRGHINLNNGNGNFYLKPNGFFSIDSLGNLRIRSSEQYNGQNLRLAIQSGPLLLNNGKLHAAFDPKSQNRFVRCGIGTYVEQGKTYLVLVKSVTPVSFYELATLFKDKYHCADALNLESGDNCSLLLPDLPVPYRHGLTPCRYLMIKL